MVTARKKRKKRYFTVGGAPGVLEVDPDAPQPQMKVIAYGPDGFAEKEVKTIAEVAGLRKTWPMVWLNVDGLGDAKTIQAIGDHFGFHALSLEDVLNVRQRPKAEAYENYLFVVLRMVDPGNTQCSSDQMSLFLGEGFVVTFQEYPGDCFDNVRERIRKGGLQKRGPKADYLAYALIDALVDHYFPVLEDFGERLDALQDEVVENPRPEVVSKVNTLKRDLLLMRRAVWPLRDELNGLLRDETFFSKETLLYLRDACDHTVALIDLIETLREISSGLMDVYLSSVSNRMNEIMKVLTVIATIFIPLSFIAGVYGMNFNTQTSAWNMPELNWAYGYPACIASMLLTAFGFLGYFWKRGWLSESKAPPTASS